MRSTGSRKISGSRRAETRVDMPWESIGLISSYLRVLRHPDFRYLFLGQSASAVGDQAVIVALALYITQRTGSATDLGLVLAAQSVPLVVLLLVGGVWADPVRWVMYSARATITA